MGRGEGCLVLSVCWFSRWYQWACIISQHTPVTQMHTLVGDRDDTIITRLIQQMMEFLLIFLFNAQPVRLHRHFLQISSATLNV